VNVFVEPRFENRVVEVAHHLIGVSIGRRVIQLDDGDAIFGGVIHQPVLHCFSGHKCLSKSDE
jgi:hypothetical protein